MFDQLYRKIAPRLKKIAKRHNGHGSFIDEDDLYQEMCVYLWDHYRDGVPEGINEAYIAKGCEFHILNYLRKNREKVYIISIDQPLNEEGETMRDILPDRSRPRETVDNDMVKEEIRNNGFSEKEKAVFFLLAEGRTMREAGRRLNISHVMVLKYKKKLIKDMRRVTKRNSFLLM